MYRVRGAVAYWSHSRGLGSSPGQGHVLLCKGRCFQSASFHLGEKLSNGDFNAGGGTPVEDKHHIQGGVEILLVQKPG